MSEHKHLKSSCCPLHALPVISSHCFHQIKTQNEQRKEMASSPKALQSIAKYLPEEITLWK